jgi:hypothetical protein
VLAEGLLVALALDPTPALSHATQCDPDAQSEALGSRGEPYRSAIDSQAVKAPSAPIAGGYDAAKSRSFDRLRMRGRKRLIVVDMDSIS